MIKDNQKVFNQLHVFMDVMITVISYSLAYFIKFYIIDAEITDVGVLPVRDYFIVLVFLVPAYVILYFFCNVYGPKRTVKRRHEFLAIFQANTLGMAFYIIILYVVIREINYSRLMMGIFYTLNIFFTCLSRVVLRTMLRTIRKRGYNLKHVLVVGYSRAAEQYIDRLLWNPQWGYKIAGILDDTVPSGTRYKGIKVLGRLDNLEVILPHNELDEVAIALALKDYDNLEHVVNVCEKSGVHTKFIPDYNSVIPTRPYTEDLMGLPVINIRYVPLANNSNKVVKRAMDIIGSTCGIIISSPLLLILARLV
ncbi:MAG: undecaprenyl-phosphate glucose phosphotransferase, partial [Acetatifactor sp.]|nr:undecaprenyl-phosphate glucose phosphotransferase [Acetatifactor sp.]